MFRASFKGSTSGLEGVIGLAVWVLGDSRASGSPGLVLWGGGGGFQPPHVSGPKAIARKSLKSMPSTPVSTFRLRSFGRGLKVDEKHKNCKSDRDPNTDGCR